MNDFFEKAEKEYYKAREKHPPFHSTHEGYAVIREELDELWDLVKANKGMKIDNGKFVEECIQIAAMVYAFVRELE